VLDITAEDNYGRDLIAGDFDAGIHLGEFIQRDMVAVRVTGEQRAAIVAAVLEDWCPPFDGYFLYYPSRRHQSPALQALVEALRV
jgi:DNA-binding transcriptional LysR family regulator